MRYGRFGVLPGASLALATVLATTRLWQLAREAAVRRHEGDEFRSEGGRFREVFDRAMIAIALGDLDGVLVEGNPALHGMLGYEPGELDGRRFAEITHPDDAASDEELYRELVSGNRSYYQDEKRYLRKDGTVVLAHLTLSLAEDEGGGAPFTVATIEDITERRRARYELRASERRFVAVIEQAPLSVHVFAPDGTSLRANRAWDELWYIEEDAPEGGDIFEDPQLQDIGLVPYLREALAGNFVKPPPMFFEPARTGNAGRPRWLQGYIYPVRDDAGRVSEVVVIEEDITERKQAEERLRASEQRFRSLVQHASDIITVVDEAGVITYLSPSVERILGYTPDELLGSRSLERIHPEDAALVRAFFAELLATPGVNPSMEIRLRHRDGSWRYMEATGNNLLADPSVRGIVVNGRDVTERREFERQLRHQAFHDDLTSLPNRALLIERLEHALERARRSGNSIAILFLDFDRFKVVNDSLGHTAGDRLLVEVGQRIQNSLRPGDTAARLGGDEFTVLLEDVSDIGGAVRVADRIADALKSPFDSQGQEVFLSTSIGIAISRGGEGRPEDLLRDADVAIDRAKANGRARYQVFDQSMNEHALQRLRLESDLRRAVDRGHLRLFYQPKLELTTGRITGVEALLRWQHPHRGLILPDDFIPLAEETGLILPIGRWVLGEACMQARRWQDVFPESSALLMSVNLSARQFQQPSLLAEVAQALRQSRLDPSRLVLEITEQVMMGDADATIGTLRELKALGVRLAIDDFGVGYSSLSYLKRFPVDALKIDRSFVAGLCKASEDAAIVQTVITLAHTLGMEVTAEGVESEEQLGQLRDLGCELGQGYLFGKPVEGRALDDVLSRGLSFRAEPTAGE